MKKLILCLCTTFFMLLLMVTNSFAESYEIFYWDGTTTTQLTNDKDWHTSLYDGTRAWYDDTAGQVKYGDGTTTTTIGSCDHSNTNGLSLYDGTTAWGRGNNQANVIYWDGTTTQTIHLAYESNPSLYNGQSAFCSGTG